MDRLTELRDIAKRDGGLGEIVKHIIKRGRTSITEHEFTAAVMESARLNKRDKESEAQAFSRIFQSDADVQKAHAICNGYTIEKASPRLMDIKPVAVDGSGAVNNTEASEAYGALTRMANEMRARAPWMSFAQAFSRSFAANPELAAKAHVRPTPTTNYAFPR